MITFGLTGGIACGKSTVTKTFRQYGIPMVDADLVSREVVVPGSPGLATVIEAFGPSFLSSDGTLDRLALGNLVFNDKLAMKKINSIMAPLIQEESARQIEVLHQQGYEIVGYDAALILEQGIAQDYRPLIVVSCPRDTQLARLMSRNSLTRPQAMARIDAQMPLEEKLRMADVVVDTSSTMDHSINQTHLIMKYLRWLNGVITNPEGSSKVLYEV